MTVVGTTLPFGSNRANDRGSKSIIRQRLRSADSVEKLVWRSGAGTAAKIDLIERPLLNATRPGDGL
jgi:hypothetical protein